MLRRISVRAIVMKNDKLLCVKLKPYNGVSKTMGVSWCLPGGGLDEGESLLDGINREMIEELGAKPKIGALLYVQQFIYSDTEFLEFFFHVTNTDDYTDVDLSKTTHGVAEIAEIAFVDPAASPILPKFLMSEPLVQKTSEITPVTFFSSL